MRRRLPPLAAIRGFEAAARLSSFREAADELHLTQSAVSHQVRTLEDFLGVSLFSRQGNRITLTVPGRAYLGEVLASLDRLEAGTARARDGQAGERLAVRGTPAFISRWLIPRIERFRAREPGIELELTTGLPPTDFSSGDVDVIVHWGQEPVPGVRIDPFLASSRFVVASPALLRATGPLRRPQDLARVTLLHDMVGDGWQGWLEQAGAATFDHRQGPRFQHCDLVLAAAERGQGVALAYGALIDHELARGTLIRLFPAETEPILIYSLACLEGRADTPKIAAFRRWITEEVRHKADQTGCAGILHLASTA